jgi:RimJ/RimL family protein N-acetyltransferase
LHLRLMHSSDIGVLSSAIIQSAGHLRPWLDWMSQATTSSEIEKMVTAWLTTPSPTGTSYGVFLGTTLVGSCDLHSHGTATLAMGYWVHVDYASQGYATEIASALTTAAFTLPDIDRIEIHHDRANQASAAIPAHLGYTLESTHPRPRSAPSEEGFTCVWSIRRGSWSPAQ